MTGLMAGGREIVNADKSPYNERDCRPPTLVREGGALWTKNTVHRGCHRPRTLWPRAHRRGKVLCHLFVFSGEGWDTGRVVQHQLRREDEREEERPQCKEGR